MIIVVACAALLACGRSDSPDSLRERVADTGTCSQYELDDRVTVDLVYLETGAQTNATFNKLDGAKLSERQGLLPIRPRELAVDDHLYWFDRLRGPGMLAHTGLAQLRRMPLDGGASEALTPWVWEPTDFCVQDGRMFWIDVDRQYEQRYWMRIASLAQPDDIRSVKLGGNTPHGLAAIHGLSFTTREDANKTWLVRINLATGQSSLVAELEYASRVIAATRSHVLVLKRGQVTAVRTAFD